jgi:anti-anti-sigma regulatory factor
MSSAGHHSLYHVDCDVGHLACADLGIVNVLARAALNTRRQGGRLCVVDASPELQELIVFAGLDAVLLGKDGRHSEQGEEPLGVEESREADDPSV